MSLFIFIFELFKVMKTNLWFKMMWNDTRLAWNPEDFGGLDTIRINAKNVRILKIQIFESLVIEIIVFYRFGPQICLFAINMVSKTCHFHHGMKVLTQS